MPRTKKQTKTKKEKRITKKNSNSVLKTISDKTVKKIVEETIDKNKRTNPKKQSIVIGARKLSNTEKKERVIEKIIYKIPSVRIETQSISIKTERKVLKSEAKKPAIKTAKKIAGIIIKTTGECSSPFLVDLKNISHVQKSVTETRPEKLDLDLWSSNEFKKPISFGEKIKNAIEDLKSVLNKKTDSLSTLLKEKTNPSVDFTLSKRKRFKKTNFFNKGPVSQLFIINLIQLFAFVFLEIGRQLSRLIILLEIPLVLLKNIFTGLLEKVYQLVPIGSDNKKYNINQLLNDYKSIRLSPFSLNSPNLLYKKSEQKISTGISLKKLIPLGFSKPLAGFTVVSLMFAMPFPAVTYFQKLQNTKEEVINVSMEGFDQFKSGGGLVSDYKLDEAKERFNQASQSFSQANNELQEINSLVTGLIKIIPQTKEAFSTGQALINIGQNLSETAKYLTEGLKPFNPELDEGNNLTEKLKIMKESLEPALPEITQIKNNLDQIETKYIPKDKQILFEKIREGLPMLEKNLKHLLSVSDSLLEIIGEKQTKRYLVVFQNDSEIRPTGGFMGSFALVDIDRGKIKNIEIPGGGSYDLKGGLREKVLSPEPLHLINPHWQFQDANWFPDFPTSAQKIIWFYEKSGGPTVDGVIAITASFVEKLIGLTGPIEMEEYEKTINSENFLIETQKAVEIEYDKKENKPKQFISDMAPKLLDKLLNSDKEKLVKIIPALSEGLRQKHILFYFTDPDFQKNISSYGWTGEIKETKKDYLSVVSSNIAGQKTDLVTKEKIEHRAEILKDGSIIDTVIITKSHEGIKNEIFSGVRNVDYIRVYVPEGSELIEARGFELPPEELFKKPDDEYKKDLDLKIVQGSVYTDKNTGTKVNNEFGKTVFGNWIQVDPGKTTVASFKYKLPFKLPLDKFNKEKTWLEEVEKTLNLNHENVLYSLLIQKQAGSQNHTFSSTVKLPENLDLYWRHPSEISSIYNKKTLSYNTDLEKDKFIALILEVK